MAQVVAVPDGVVCAGAAQVATRGARLAAIDEIGVRLD